MVEKDENLYKFHLFQFKEVRCKDLELKVKTVTRLGQLRASAQSLEVATG